MGWQPQDRIAAFNRAFDVCLMPYSPDHPFNRVCCPTKIMDYMATGRPVVEGVIGVGILRPLDQPNDVAGQ